jgi:geranylgeranyl diphosphate synthase, type I
MTAVLPDPVAEATAAVMPAIEAALGELHPSLATVARYHRGTADADGRPAAAGGGGGKALRATIAMLAAEAAGDASAGTAAATAVELVHDFSLLHDDVMDGDRTRRGRPAAWVVFGAGRAVLAGDALLVLACGVLASCGSDRAARAVDTLMDATAELIDGQARDLALEGAERATVDDTLRMCAGKTGALLGCSAGLGALLGGGSPAVVDALAGFGRHLGIAFQARDDILGIWGLEPVTGKPAYGDLRRRKRSLPVTFALAAADGTAPALRRELDAAPDAPEGQVERLALRLEHAGARRRTEELAAQELAAALDLLEGAAVPPGVRDRLESVARFVTERDR